MASNWETRWLHQHWSHRSTSYMDVDTQIRQMTGSLPVQRASSLPVIPDPLPGPQGKPCEVGDWIRAGYDNRHRPCHRTDAPYLYEGIVAGFTGCSILLENGSGHLDPAGVFEVISHFCECGERRPHDDYACASCKATP